MPLAMSRKVRPAPIALASPALAILAVLGTTGCPGRLPFAEVNGSGPDGSDVDASPASLGGGSEAAAPPAEAAAGCADVPALLAHSCATAGCHDATTQAQALDLASPDVAARLVDVPATEGAGLLIDPANPTASVLYTKLLAMPPFGARMPTGTPLDAASTQCVLAWVTAQAGSAPIGDAGPHGGDAAASDAAGGDAGGPPSFTTVRVAAGQTGPVTDTAGNVWLADEQFTGGVGLAPSTPPVAIAGSDTPALYDGQRYGNPSFSYAFPVPDGTYAVTLKFAEQYVTGPGLRLFSIAMNGMTVEPNLDIYAAAGAMNTAVDRRYRVQVTGGTLKIDFTQGTVQFPKVDAIAIEAAPADGGP